MPAGAGGSTYGVEYNQATINTELNHAPGTNAYLTVRHGGSVAEHGTHVTGIAAGNGLGQAGTFTGAAPEADIIFVSPFGTPGIALASDNTFVLDAFSYIFARAAALGAQAGTLIDPAEIQSQVERMLALPAVQESLTKTLMAAWQIGNIFGTVKDPGLFPEYTPALQASMFRETEAVVQAVRWTRDAPGSELRTSRESFVDSALAALYGVSFSGGAGGELAPATLPAERAGLLTQASVMSLLSRTDNTSVVARGLFVRGALLCLPKINSPPEELAGEITALLAADMPERERADVRATTQPCGSCHAGFDPFGLLLESYDPIGRHRDTIEGVPIDSSTPLNGLGGFMGSFPDAVSFAQAAAASPEFTKCLTRNLVAYGTGDDALEANHCQVEDAVALLPPSPTMRDLVRAATASPALVYRRVEAAP
jgi:hypothetical protein